MNTAGTNREPQQQNNQVPLAVETTGPAASTAEPLPSQKSVSLQDRSRDTLKSASKYLFGQSTAKDLATKKKKKMAHRRSLRASHTKG